MKTNRFVSLALAGAMVTAMTVPALAVDPPNMSTKFTSTYTAPTISVVVPQTAAAVINPLGLGMSVKDSNDAIFNLTGQIVSAPAAIENQSNLRLNVGASVIGSIKEVTGVTDFAPMKFASSTTKGTGTEGEEDYVAPPTGKSAFVKLEVVKAPDAVVGSDSDEIADKVIAESAKAATWTGAKGIVVGTKEAKNKEDEPLATLEKATVDASDGSFTAYPKGSVALIRLTGDCVKAPKGGWSDKDGFEVNVTFTFEPAADAPSTGG